MTCLWYSSKDRDSILSSISSSFFPILNWKGCFSKTRASLTNLWEDCLWLVGESIFLKKSRFLTALSKSIFLLYLLIIVKFGVNELMLYRRSYSQTSLAKPIPLICYANYLFPFVSSCLILGEWGSLRRWSP